MADTFESRTLTVRIARPRPDVYDFLSAPEKFRPSCGSPPPPWDWHEPRLSWIVHSYGVRELRGANGPGMQDKSSMP
jgi:hypothetical protein